MNIENEQSILVKQRTKEITDKYTMLGQIQPNLEVSPALAHEFILKEVSATLAYQKRLHAHVSRLENENNLLEKSVEEKKMAPQPLISVPVATVKPHAVTKISRKNREHRSRSQEWPDVPDVGKIEEQNPELLAQKILETGRKIEANKLNLTNIKHSHSHMNGHVRDSEKLGDYKMTRQNMLSVGRNHVRAPPLSSHPQKQLSIKVQKPLNVVNKVQESPKVINFEDRLKSIITSVLNEDQEQRKAAQAGTHTFSSNSYPHQQTQNYPTNQMIYNNHLSTTPNYSSIHLHGQNHSQTSPIDVKPAIQEYKHSTSERFHHSEACMRPFDGRPDVYRGDVIRQGDKLTEMYRSQSELSNQTREASPNTRGGIQPDYTQVSPAKLALRRHLSQEKLSQHHPSTIVAARTIGDLVNGEIERTLEISNQSIINAAVNMSKLVTPSNMMNANIPPRPERVNVRIDVNHDSIRQAYSPISRPNSTDASDSFPSSVTSKSPHSHSNTVSNNSVSSNSYPVNSPHNRTSHLSEPFVPSCTTVVYQSSKNNYSSHQGHSQYVPLPRAEIKPFHELYFNETKPPPDAAPPLEGLAASLQARILASEYWKVKEEDRTQFPTVEESISSQPTSVIKTEVCEKSPVLCQYNDVTGLKRLSPVIQKPLKPAKKPHLDFTVSASFPLPMPSPEPHSNTSTPLVDEVPERERALRPDEGSS